MKHIAFLTAVCAVGLYAFLQWFDGWARARLESDIGLRAIVLSDWFTFLVLLGLAFIGIAVGSALWDFLESSARPSGRTPEPEGQE